MADTIIIPSDTTYTIPSGTYTTPPRAFDIGECCTVTGASILFHGNGEAYVAPDIYAIAIKTDGRSIITLSNSTFSAISATCPESTEGSANIYLEGVAVQLGPDFYTSTPQNPSTANFTDCYFVDNSGIYASGAAFYGHGVLCIDGSTFTNNSATARKGYKEHELTGEIYYGIIGGGQGGAIYNHSHTNVSGGTISITAYTTITDSDFQNNYAEYQGGAVHLSGCVTCTNVNFAYNICDGECGYALGGAVYMGGSDEDDFVGEVFEGVTVTSNTAGSDGGGVYNEGELYSTGSTYSLNIAGESGGGVYNSYHAEFTDDIFNNNAAEESGGGVYNEWGLRSNGSTYSGNTAGESGGAIYNEGINEYDEEYWGGLYSTGSTYSQNGAGESGGAVYNSCYATAEFTDDIFCANTAVDGGAIYNEEGVELTIDSSTFSSNIADVDGGAIYNYGADEDGWGYVSIKDSVFNENTADNGGAIYNYGADEEEYGNVSIENSVFKENTAENGGAIYNASGEIEISSSTFSANEATVGGAIYNEEEGVIHISGSTFATASESIRNLGDVYFSDTNILNAVLDGSGLSHSEAANTVIKGAGTVGQTYTADAFATTFGAADSGMNIDATVIGGGTASIADDAKLHFVNATMTAASKIYGAGVAAAGESYSADSVAIDFAGTGMGAKALVCAGGKGAAGASIEVGTITVTSSASGDMGILYGGADLTDGGSFKAGTVTTTISGNGNYLSFVGNGCRNGNTAAAGVTTDIETSIVSISGGTFNNLVYGGAYAAGDNVSVDNAIMSISGGTFNFSVYGGNGGKSTSTTQQGKSVVGSVNVTVDVTGDNTVVFNRHLSSGSFGDGTVSGDTHMTFTGDGANLSFGANSYVSGHSQNAYHLSVGNPKVSDFGTEYVQTFVKGHSYLDFNAFTGVFTGSLSNGFSDVSFSSDSSVVLKGAIESDLRYTSVWNLAIGSSTDTLLDWSKATKAKNSFEGDTINLTLKEAFTGSKVLMNAGNDANLLTGWDSATVTLGGGTMTYNSDNKYYSDGSYKLYVDTTSGNRLMLASL